jgi:hypothetical protein
MDDCYEHYMKMEDQYFLYAFIYIPDETYTTGHATYKFTNLLELRVSYAIWSVGIYLAVYTP